MKKIKAIVLSASLCAAMLLSGCVAKPETDYGIEHNGSNGSDNSDSSGTGELSFGKAEISEVRENYAEDAERVRNKSYENLYFNDTVFFPFPELDAVSELTLTPLTIGKSKSADELYKFFCEAVDKLTDNKYSDEEKRYEIRFVDGSKQLETGASADQMPYPYDSPTIDDYELTEYPYLTIDNKDYFIDMICGALRGYDNGALIEYDGINRSWRGMYFMIDFDQLHRPVFYTEDLTCSDTYRLVDGEISIADAAKFAQSYLDNLKFTPYEGNIPKPRIYAVNVVDIGKERYGYNFLTTVEYKGMDFEHHYSNGIGGSYSGVLTDYDTREYTTINGKIDMIETDKIHHFMSIAYGVEITEGEPTTEIITLEAAADIISDFYSESMKFAVQEVSAAWLPTDDRDTDAGNGCPCWKFRMTSNGEMYHTLVNMITGEVYLYVQTV